MNEPAKLPSDRSFGFLFVVVFALIAGVAWWRASSLALWSAVLSVLTLVVTLVRPSALRPLNRIWMKLAELLHRFVSPIVLGIIYFVLLTPIAWIFRLRGRDVLRRRADPAVSSYWISRDPPGPDPKSFPNQY